VAVDVRVDAMKIEVAYFNGDKVIFTFKQDTAKVGR